METSSKNADHTAPESAPMTDAAFASDLIQETFPTGAGRNVKAAIGEAFSALKRRERQLPCTVLRNRQRQWTERRVKALWFGEARRVDHYEIQDLTAVAVEEARIERQRLKAREDRLAAFLAAHEAGEDGEERHPAGWEAVGLDRSRAGTDADETSDQSQGWGR